MSAQPSRTRVLAALGVALFLSSARAQGVPSDAGTDDATQLPVAIEVLAPDASVASGRGVSVNAAELLARIDDAPEPERRAWAANPALLEELLDRLVADRLMANEARRLGLDRDPAVRAAVDRALIARLRATVIDPQSPDGSHVTQDDIQAFYDSHPQRFHIPERRVARVIFVTHRRDAERILALATMMRHHHAVHDFHDLVLHYETDPDLVRSEGEIREVTPAGTEIDSALRDAIFAIAATGDVHASVVRATWHGTPGFFIVRLTSRRAAIERTVSESADWIRQRLVLQHRADAERTLVERLARDAGVVRMPMSQVVRVGVVDAGAD